MVENDEAMGGQAASELRRRPSRQSLNSLDWLNFLLADVQTGVGPFLAIYLADSGWNPEWVGFALTIGGIAGIVAQTPAGALVDQLKAKRSLIAFGVIALATGALLFAFWPSFWPVIAGQGLVGATSSVFMPAIAAISLGIVGSESFDRRQGRNQAFNSAGNVTAALIMGAVGYVISNRAIFFFVAVLAIPTIFSLMTIKPDEIDYEVARGARDGVVHDRPARLRELLEDRPLLVFFCCAVMFHFANAAMLPLLGEMLAEGKGRSSMMFMSACVITTQLTITLLAGRAGIAAASRGRRPLLLIGFGVLPIRGFLYTIAKGIPLLVAIQILDGIGAGIFGVVSVLVIADLTRGTGRFNLTLGAVATAVGIGAAFSQTVAGTIVRHYGYRTGFLFLASVAAAAFIMLWLMMPETMHSNARNT